MQTRSFMTAVEAVPAHTQADAWMWTSFRLRGAVVEYKGDHAEHVVDGVQTRSFMTAVEAAPVHTDASAWTSATSKGAFKGTEPEP